MDDSEIVYSIIQKLSKVKDEVELAMDAEFSQDLLRVKGMLVIEPGLHMCYTSSVSQSSGFFFLIYVNKFAKPQSSVCKDAH